MGGRGAALIVVAASLLAGCGATQAEEGDFDPAAAERFILNKARADVRANPALLVKDPEDPTVECRELQPDTTETEEEARFECEVRIIDEDGKTLGRQTWRAEVELDQLTGDTVVRSSRRTATTITPAPVP